MFVLLLFFPHIFILSSFSHNLALPTPKEGKKIIQPMFFQKPFFENFWTFLIFLLIFLSSSILVFILFNFFYQSPLQNSIDMNK